mmetsp:Transcript_27766/g.88266  ORF Transcript_27766/g.88266 Transcript_27766/m.88266 type:complete len:203 (+) Transcript_27766:942-1550(+)
MPRSRAFASSWVTQTPRRSPCVADWTGLRNICIDLILRVCLSSGNSISWPILSEPERTVPVSTVPCPLIGKQWSMAKCRGPSCLLSGSATRALSSSTSALTPTAAAPPDASLAADRWSLAVRRRGGRCSRSAVFARMVPTAVEKTDEACDDAASDAASMERSAPSRPSPSLLASPVPLLGPTALLTSDSLSSGSGRRADLPA